MRVAETESASAALRDRLRDARDANEALARRDGESATRVASLERRLELARRESADAGEALAAARAALDELKTRADADAASAAREIRDAKARAELREHAGLRAEAFAKLKTRDADAATRRLDATEAKLRDARRKLADERAARVEAEEKLARVSAEAERERSEAMSKLALAEARLEISLEARRREGAARRTEATRRGGGGKGERGARTAAREGCTAFGSAFGSEFGAERGPELGSAPSHPSSHENSEENSEEHAPSFHASASKKTQTEDAPDTALTEDARVERAPRGDPRAVDDWLPATPPSPPTLLETLTRGAALP